MSPSLPAPPRHALSPVTPTPPCPQACSHCHVESSPLRTREQASREVVDRCLQLLAAAPHVSTLDVTGGAPELNANFRCAGVAGQPKQLWWLHDGPHSDDRRTVPKLLYGGAQSYQDGCRPGGSRLPLAGVYTGRRRTALQGNGSWAGFWAAGAGSGIACGPVGGERTQGMRRVRVFACP